MNHFTNNLFGHYAPQTLMSNATNGMQTQNPNVNDKPSPDDIDYSQISDEQFWQDMVVESMGETGFDWDNKTDGWKTRYAQYIRSMQDEDKQKSAGLPNFMSMGLSQANAPNMSKPSVIGLGGLMQMARGGRKG